MSKKNDKKKKDKVPFKQSVKNNLYMIKLAYKCDKVLIIIRLIAGLLTGLNHGISVYFISEILNSLDRHDDINHIFWLIGFMGLYTLAYELFFAWYYKLLHPTHKLNFIRVIHKSFFVKASDIDLACYDTPEFYNDFILPSSPSVQEVWRLCRPISMPTPARVVLPPSYDHSLP